MDKWIICYITLCEKVIASAAINKQLTLCKRDVIIYFCMMAEVNSWLSMHLYCTLSLTFLTLNVVSICNAFRSTNSICKQNINNTPLHSSTLEEESQKSKYIVFWINTLRTTISFHFWVFRTLIFRWVTTRNLKNHSQPQITSVGEREARRHEWRQAVILSLSHRASYWSFC